MIDLMVLMFYLKSQISPPLGLTGIPHLEEIVLLLILRLMKMPLSTNVGSDVKSHQA